MLAGQHWEQEIQDALQQSSAFIALISSHAMRRESPCHGEFDFAWDFRMKIIPVVVQQRAAWERPIRLRLLQYVDLADFDSLTGLPPDS